MSTIIITIEAKSDSATLQSVIQERLEQAPIVEQATLSTEQTTTGLVEPLTIIVGTITVLRLGADLLTQLRAFVRELHGLKEDIKEVRTIRLDLGVGPKDVNALSDSDIQQFIKRDAAE